MYTNYYTCVFAPYDVHMVVANFAFLVNLFKKFTKKYGKIVYGMCENIILPVASLLKTLA